MNPEILLLVRLKQSGYFDGLGFDPKPVYTVCHRDLSIDVTTTEGGRRLDELIRSLVSDQLIRFEYSPDPTLHPKDSLDYWRIHLTSGGQSKVENFTKVTEIVESKTIISSDFIPQKVFPLKGSVSMRRWR
jgi:hypothetical protein